MRNFNQRANRCRPSGHWSEDDYDVFADGAVVGRNLAAAPIKSSPCRVGLG